MKSKQIAALFCSLGVHSLLKVFTEVLLVEPHGGGDRTCGPIDHHIGQEVVQRELPATHIDGHTQM